MEHFQGYKQSLEKELADDSKPWSKYLKLAEEKTGVSRTYLFFGKLHKTSIICLHNANICATAPRHLLHESKYSVRTGKFALSRLSKVIFFLLFGNYCIMLLGITFEPLGFCCLHRDLLPVFFTHNRFSHRFFQLY